jgi:hypothetical protein
MMIESVNPILTYTFPMQFSVDSNIFTSVTFYVCVCLHYHITEMLRKGP